MIDPVTAGVTIVKIQAITKLYETTLKHFGPIFTEALKIKNTANAINKSLIEHQKILKNPEFKNTNISINPSAYSIEKPAEYIPIETPTPALAIEQRTQLRINYQEKKRQENLEKIIGNASEILTHIDSVDNDNINNDPVDDDWITRFFNYAADVSDVDLQNLYGRILAGEIKQPNSFSLKTLEILRSLSKKDLGFLELLAPYVLMCGGLFFFPRKNIFIESMLPISKMLELVDYNILQSNSITDFGTSVLLTKNDPYLRSNIIIIKVDLENRDTLPLKAITFTQFGKEIIKLVETKYNKEYLHEYAKEIERDNKTTSKYAYITGIKGNLLSHTNFKDFPIT